MLIINDFLKQGKLGAFNTGHKDLQAITGHILRTLKEANKPDPVLFRHGGGLVWVETDDHARPTLKEITQDRMRGLLARRYGWYRKDKRGQEVPACPPLEVVRDALAFPNIDLPIVERIVCVPTFAPNGTIQLNEGYSAGSRTILIPGDVLPYIPAVSDRPSPDDVSKALALFYEAMHDFPFVGSGRAHALAATLVPFVRAMIKGPTPLHLIEKPEPGTGATLLAEIICDISLGYPIAAMTEARCEDEFTRKIHSKLRSGPAVILLDNVRNYLQSGSFAAALTGDLFEDRIVQRSETSAVPVRCLWLGTANNPSLSHEMVRRTVPIRLDAQSQRPYLRTGFRHPNLREWVDDTLPELVWAMLTLVKAWVAAGSPKGSKTLGMYENYSRVIGGILAVAGVAGFLEDQQEQAELADDDLDLAPLIPLWRDSFGFEPVLASQLLPLCTELSLEGDSEGARKIRLGKLLRANRGRRFDDIVIAQAGERNNSKLWRLAMVEEA